MSMFKLNGVQSILNEEKLAWNKIEPSIFEDMVFNLGYP